MTTLLALGAIVVLVFMAVTLGKKTSRRGKGSAPSHHRFGSTGANTDPGGMVFLPLMLSSSSNDNRDANPGESKSSADYGGGDSGASGDSSGGDAGGGGGDGGGGGGGD